MEPVKKSGSKTEDTIPGVRLRESGSSFVRASVDLCRAGAMYAYYDLYWKQWNRLEMSCLMAWFPFLVAITPFIASMASFSLFKDVEILRRQSVEVAAVAVYILAIVALFFERLKKRREARTEEGITARSWLLLQQASQQPNMDALLKLATERVVWPIFRVLGAKRVWVWIATDSGSLRVHSASVYPATSDHKFVLELAPGEGIAGRVHADGLPRYVPRLFLPFLPRTRSTTLAHALKFDVMVNGDTFSFSPQAVTERQVVLSDGRVPTELRSFVAVPVRRSSSASGFGVLCIDFQTSNPIGTKQIETAAFIGALIAGEIQELRGPDARAS